MKKNLFIFMILSGFASANPLGGNPTDGYCQTVDGSACGWGGNGGSSQRRGINIPNHWGAIYYNPANRAFGYSDNNTKSYESAEEEALAGCIKAGGNKNPIASDGKGCRLGTKNQNSCSAIAMGKVEGYAIRSNRRLERAEQEALKACSKYSDSCEIRYSACSRHPDYLRY